MELSGTRQHALPTLPFKSFGLTTIYGFLSGLSLGLALNIFASVRVTPPTSAAQERMFYLACVCFFLSSLGLLIVTWSLETASRDWLAEGAPRDQHLMLDHVAKRLGILWSGLLLSLLAALGGGLALWYRPSPLLDQCL